MRYRIPIGTGLVTVALATALACGSPPPGEQTPPVPTATSAPVTTEPTRTTPAQGQQVQAEGVVTEGVEATCLVLKTDAETYLLVGGDKTVLTPGRRVRVNGMTRPDMASFCMQGTPLEVKEALAL